MSTLFETLERVGPATGVTRKVGYVHLAGTAE